MHAKLYGAIPKALALTPNWFIENLSYCIEDNCLPMRIPSIDCVR